jgi:hypothetical protein
MSSANCILYLSVTIETASTLFAVNLEAGDTT